MPTQDDNTPSLVSALRKKKGEKSSALVELVEAGERARSHLVPKWRRNRCYVRGEHYGTWNRQRTQWREVAYTAKEEVLKSRATYNHTRKLQAQFRGQMTRERPMFDAATGTSETEDRAATKASKGLIQWGWRQFGLQDLYGNIADASFATLGVIHLDWDDQAGPEGEIEEEVEVTPPRMEPELDPFSGIVGQGIVPAETKTQKKKVRQGMPRFRQIRAEGVICDPTASASSPGWWICIREKVSSYSIRNTFGVAALKKVDVSPEGGDQISREGPAASESDETVDLYTLYVREGRDFPRGKRIVFTDGEILDEGDNPKYPDPDEPDALWPRHPWPVWLFWYYHDEEHPYGVPAVDDLVDPQNHLNGVKSKIRILIKKQAHAVRFAPKGVKSAWDSDDPAAILEIGAFQDRNQFGYVNPPPIPSELFAEAADAQQQMDVIVSINAATQGRSNSENSGVKDRQLIEQDAGSKVPIKTRFDNVWADILQHYLVLMRRHLTTDMMAVIVGENDRAELETFSQSQLATATDVFPINNFSSSDPVRKMLLLGSFIRDTNGMDPAERQKLAEATLGVGSGLFIERELSADRERAIKDVQRLYQGEQVQVGHWFDERPMLAVFYAEMNSDSWLRRTTPQPDDEQGVAEQKIQLREAFMAHVQKIEEQLNYKMGAEKPPPEPGAPSASGSPSTASPPQLPAGSVAAPKQPVGSGA